ncbi:DUF342 domain-containing protein [Desulfurispira natronophila]|uniref:Flagellar Assembly Protein A N-terminal region domain-containing protein n=1 Tax=Desulfurispira natronophila TaxID=682562 RepID=A0A7W7Y2A9_9BACT|nr:FapA family protein [Desulfurispira natronophila]MBB5020771.1 hypothetical protein [Desulfurispira natronophila]
MTRSIAINPWVSLEISSDQLEAYLIVWSLEHVDERHISEVIRDAGIEEQYVKNLPSVLQQLIDEASKKRSAFPLRATVAQGVTARHGIDEQINFFINPNPSPGTINSTSGQIDYRERDLIKQVCLNESILEIVWATAGVSGANIFGQTLPARDGLNTSKIIAGDGVEAIKEPYLRRTRFVAKQDGVLLVNRREIVVSKELNIRGDVDYSTGNVSFDGTILVSGNILSGFRVLATGHVYVAGYLESRSEVIGHSVTVGKGCYGRIKSKRHVQVDFAENAQIQSQGTVTIGSLSRSWVSGRDIMVKNVTSSNISAFNDIHVEEVKSSTNMPTFMITHSPGALEAINQFRAQHSNVIFEISQVEEYVANFGIQRQEIERALGNKNSSVPPELISKIRHKRNLEGLAQRLQNAVEHLLLHTHGTVSVLDYCEPDTVIGLYGVEKYLMQQMRRCIFYYDHNHSTIKSKEWM